MPAYNPFKPSPTAHSFILFCLPPGYLVISHPLQGGVDVTRSWPILYPLLSTTSLPSLVPMQAPPQLFVAYCTVSNRAWLGRSLGTRLTFTPKHRCVLDITSSMKRLNTGTQCADLQSKLSWLSWLSDSKS